MVFGNAGWMRLSWAGYSVQCTADVWISSPVEGGTGVPPVNHAQDARATSNCRSTGARARLTAGACVAYSALL